MAERDLWAKGALGAAAAAVAVRVAAARNTHLQHSCLNINKQINVRGA